MKYVSKYSRMLLQENKKDFHCLAGYILFRLLYIVFNHSSPLSPISLSLFDYIIRSEVTFNSFRYSMPYQWPFIELLEGKTIPKLDEQFLPNYSRTSLSGTPRERVFSCAYTGFHFKGFHLHRSKILKFHLSRFFILNTHFNKTEVQIQIVKSVIFWGSKRGY